MTDPDATRLGPEGRRRMMMTEGAVGPTLLRLAGPMAVGMAAIMLFTIVDTFFVGQLGAAPLAAMSFCFPITFVVLSITMGLGMGTTSVIARAIGRGDRQGVRRLTTHALLLAGAVVAVVVAVGLATIDPVFTALGARGETLELVHEYMEVWYWGVGFLVVPMIGNSAIRATGDTRSPSIIMIVAGVANAVLDPPLIFGLGPFPALGLQGAALATALSWTLTFAAATWLLTVREKMVEFRLHGWWASWREILYVGAPAAGTNLLIPLSAAVLTRFVATYGEHAVAGYGVATRIESLAIIGVNALSSAMTPFVGQNFGAHRCDRVREAVRFSMRASLGWGAGVAVLSFALARPVSSWFNDADTIVSASTAYLRIVPISYGLVGIGMLMNTTFIALGRPAQASLLIVIRLFVLAVPLAYAGSILLGRNGLFVGIALGNAATAAVAWTMSRRILARAEAEAPAGAPVTV
ncbi:MAG: MATE family efflux transporter [Myxococcota bacterium]